MNKDKKDKFDSLEGDWKDLVNNLDEVEIKKKVAEIALEHSLLMKAKKEDQDLDEKRESYKEAGAVYRENSKMSKLRIEYLRSLLEGKGKM